MYKQRNVGHLSKWILPSPTFYSTISIMKIQIKMPVLDSFTPTSKSPSVVHLCIPGSDKMLQLLQNIL
jgi:hypothetical protein